MSSRTKTPFSTNGSSAMIRRASAASTPSSRLMEPELSAKGPPITNVPFSIRASMNSACWSQPGWSRTPPLVHVGPARQTTTTRVGTALRLLDDAVAKVRYEGGIEHARQLEPGQLGADALEQAGSVAQQDRGEVELELVDQAGVDALVDCIGAACDQDVLLGRRGSRILDRALDPVRDEGKGGSPLHGERLARVVGEDEHRDVEGRVVTPPALAVGVALPGPLAAAEHAAAHHDGAGRAQRFRDELVVRARLAAGQAVRLAKALEPKGPLVQLVAALAQRVLERRSRPGDVTVERDRDLRDDFPHLSPLRRFGGRGRAMTGFVRAHRLRFAEKRPSDQSGRGGEGRADEEGEVVAAGESA